MSIDLKEKSRVSANSILKNSRGCAAGVKGRLLSYHKGSRIKSLVRVKMLHKNFLPFKLWVRVSI